MTELERLLTLQLQQSQREAEQMQAEHKAEIEGLQQQLSGLQSAWETTGKDYALLYRQQQENFERYKQQIEGAFQNLNKEVELKDASTAHTLQILENSLVALAQQLSSLTRQLKG